MNTNNDEYIHALNRLNDSLLIAINLERKINGQQNQKLGKIREICNNNLDVWDIGLFAEEILEVLDS